MRTVIFISALMLRGTYLTVHGMDYRFASVFDSIAVVLFLIALIIFDVIEFVTRVKK